MSSVAEAPKTIRSTIPARLDRLSWSPFHTRMVAGLGTDRTGLFIGYLIGGGIMVIGGLVELAIGIKAEGKSLEDITKPITSTGDTPEAGAAPAPAG